MKDELHENEENKRTAWQRKGGKNMENIIILDYSRYSHEEG